jgi:hypothetical protein
MPSRWKASRRSAESSRWATTSRTRQPRDGRPVPVVDREAEQRHEAAGRDGTGNHHSVSMMSVVAPEPWRHPEGHTAAATRRPRSLNPRGRGPSSAYVPWLGGWRDALVAVRVVRRRSRRRALSATRPGRRAGERGRFASRGRERVQAWHLVCRPLRRARQLPGPGSPHRYCRPRPAQAPLALRRAAAPPAPARARTGGSRFRSSSRRCLRARGSAHTAGR